VASYLSVETSRSGNSSQGGVVSHTSSKSTNDNSDPSVPTVKKAKPHVDRPHIILPSGEIVPAVETPHYREEEIE
jgi:hypothetical protein